MKKFFQKHWFRYGECALALQSEVGKELLVVRHCVIRWPRWRAIWRKIPREEFCEYQFIDYRKMAVNWLTYNQYLAEAEYLYSVLEK